MARARFFPDGSGASLFDYPNMKWVDPTAPAGGDGTIGSPFNSLTSAVAGTAGTATFMVVGGDLSAEATVAYSNRRLGFVALSTGTVFPDITATNTTVAPFMDMFVESVGGNCSIGTLTVAGTGSTFLHTKNLQVTSAVSTAGSGLARMRAENGFISASTGLWGFVNFQGMALGTCEIQEPQGKWSDVAASGTLQYSSENPFTSFSNCQFFEVEKTGLAAVGNTFFIDGTTAIESTTWTNFALGAPSVTDNTSPIVRVASIDPGDTGGNYSVPIASLRAKILNRVDTVATDTYPTGTEFGTLLLPGQSITQVVVNGASGDLTVEAGAGVSWPGIITAPAGESIELTFTQLTAATTQLTATAP